MAVRDDVEMVTELLRDALEANGLEPQPLGYATTEVWVSDRAIRIDVVAPHKPWTRRGDT